MDEEKQLAKTKKKSILADEKGLKLRSFDDMWRFATAVVASRIYRNLETPEVAVVKIQAGAELGLTPVWALSNIFVVNGTPAVYGDALIGLVRQQPGSDVIEQFTDKDGKILSATEATDDRVAAAICEAIRKDKNPIVRSFSIEDAKRAGLWGKAGPWTQYPKRMLQMRARAWACRDGFADVLRGLAVVEEVADIEPRETVKASPIKEMILPDEIKTTKMVRTSPVPPAPDTTPAQEPTSPVSPVPDVSDAQAADSLIAVPTPAAQDSPKQEQGELISDDENVPF